jgi:hypothetical protein
MTQLADYSRLDISQSAIELEESVLGAILLDPKAIAAVDKLPIEAFSISAHQQIFRVMLELHQKNLLPDLLAVAFSLGESGILNSIGGKTKLASLLDRTVHSYLIEQYAALLLKKYYRRYLGDRISSLAQQAQTSLDIGEAISLVQSELEQIRCVTSDSISNGDTSNPNPATLSITVTRVTRILEQGLPQWEEIALLDALQSTCGISKTSFAHLVASVRCQSDEVTSTDKQQLTQLIEWKNASLDYAQVLPHLASDLLHDARVLNIDPVMLWQYLLPATLSLLGKKANLCVGSHQIPAIAWTCIVGESGIGKSRAEGVILAALRAWQKAEYDRFKTEWAEHKKSQNQNKKSDDSSPPEPPQSERKFLFGIATIQAVMRRLSEQGLNGSLWARDEIAGLFKSLGQFTAKGEGEGLECLLPMWDGAPAPVDRVLHDDSYHVDSSRLSIAGGLQPLVFRKIFSDPDDAQGVQARFLFALPKVHPAKRVQGYCHLSEKLPEFYRWVDTQFPEGNIKLSTAADALYNTAYESIGRSAESASTPAVRAWMRKLPGQLLRIALALHVIECYHESKRPKHELQADTLNRAIDICRYYRSTFEVVQESVSDSNHVSSILLKIWDMAATSPSGLLVRDAYRHIKALSRCAKEQGRSVAAYTTDLYYQLEKMGRGNVERNGRVVRFVAGITNRDNTLPPDGGEGVTVVTVNETNDTQGLELSPLDLVSPVTDSSKKNRAGLVTPQVNNDASRLTMNPALFFGEDFVTKQNLEQVATYYNETDVPSLPVQADTLGSVENIISMNRESDVTTKNEGSRESCGWNNSSRNLSSLQDISPTSAIYPIQGSPHFYDGNSWGSASLAAFGRGEIVTEVSQSDVDQIDPKALAETSAPDETHLLSKGEIQSWLDRIANVQSADECIDCMDALNQLLPSVNELILTNAETLLPRFWEILDQGQHKAESGFSGKVLQQHQEPDESGDRITKTNGYEKPVNPNATDYVKNLIAGLWVRTRDGFYGHLAAMQADGRWWVRSPCTRNSDAQSRLYAAVDIIPMSAS